MTRREFPIGCMVRYAGTGLLYEVFAGRYDSDYRVQMRAQRPGSVDHLFFDDDPRYELVPDGAVDEPPLKWTATPPTAPGWYWARREGRPPREPSVVRVHREYDGFVAYVVANECDLPLDIFDLWVGPIVAPVMP